jgi:flagellar P-ring protein FlgI
MFRHLVFGLLASLPIFLSAPTGRAEPSPPRRTAHLVGYGLVMGLDGTGDHLSTAPFTAQSLKLWLAKQESPTDDLSRFEGCVAGVIVTASLSIDPAEGRPMDLVVSSMGDATSLAGGQLIMTALVGPDGKVHAVGEGTLRPCAPHTPGTDCLTKDCTVPQCVPSGGVRAAPS